MDDKLLGGGSNGSILSVKVPSFAAGPAPSLHVSRGPDIVLLCQNSQDARHGDGRLTGVSSRGTEIVQIPLEHYWPVSAGEIHVQTYSRRLWYHFAEVAWAEFGC